MVSRFNAWLIAWVAPHGEIPFLENDHHGCGMNFTGVMKPDSRKG